MTRKIVITHWIKPEIVEYLSHSFLVIPNTGKSSLSREEILERTRDAHAIMVFTGDLLDAAFLDECPRLRIVAAAFRGAGSVDAEACTTRKVWFTDARAREGSSADGMAGNERAAVLEAAANIFEALLGRRPQGAVNRITHVRQASAPSMKTPPLKP